MNIVLHSGVDPTSLIAAARETVRRADPDLALYDVLTMQARMERSLWVRRTYSWLFGVFAALALALAIAGIYGVVSYAVTQRTREIGIRMALGANPSQVLGGVLREGMLLAAIGVAIGIAGALAATRLLESLLAGVSPHDPWAFVAVSIGLGVATLAANFIPGPASGLDRPDASSTLRVKTSVLTASFGRGSSPAIRTMSRDHRKRWTFWVPHRLLFLTPP